MPQHRQFMSNPGMEPCSFAGREWRKRTGILQPLLALALLPLLIASARAYDILDLPFDYLYAGNPTSLTETSHNHPVTISIQGVSGLEFIENSPAAGTDALYFRNIGTSSNDGSLLQIPDADALTQGSSGGFRSLSISVWIKPDEYRLGQIVRKTDLSQDVGYQLFLHSNGLLYFRVEQAGGVYGQIATNQVIPLDSQWHQVIAVWHGDGHTPELSLSVDGVMVTTAAVPVSQLTNTATPLTIGGLYRSSTSKGQFFSGGIDALRITEVGATTAALTMSFDDPNFPASPLRAKDQSNGFIAEATVQGSSSIAFSATSPQSGRQSLVFSNAGTSNNDGSYLSIADHPLLTGSSWEGGLTSLLIDLWIQPTEHRQAQLVRKTTGSTDEGYQLFLHGSGLVYFRVQQADGAFVQVATASTVPLDGQWHRLLATWNGRAASPQVALSLDGVVTSASAAALTELSDTSGPLTIGGLWRSAGNTGQFFNGKMDQLRVSMMNEYFVNAIGMSFAQIPAGSFTMGQAGINFDEEPLHAVSISQPFLMGTTEVTNEQYEHFRPAHVRGELAHNDHPVTYVTYQDALDFCAWLTARDASGLIYRLPSEAEWEYAARAGSTGAFPSGASLPAGYVTDAVVVGTNAPNPWGLHEMFGNVEEWCLDWYGPYVAGPQSDPVGRFFGATRVTRGGSYYFGDTSFDPLYTRSANRGATLPGDADRVLGFRVVIGPQPSTPPLPEETRPLVQQAVTQAVASYAPVSGPFFRAPRNFVKVGEDLHGPFYSQHNHDPALTHCPNGDLLAIWFSTEDDGPVLTEQGRRISLLGSRLRRGMAQWDQPSVFFDAADRNEGGPTLWHDESTGRLFHFNGIGSVNWSSMAAIVRTSDDNGANWSELRLAQPHGGQGGGIESVIKTADGQILVPFDAPSGTTLIRSGDGGQTWVNPLRNVNNAPVVGQSGPNIWGIHAGIVQLLDGRLLSIGRTDTSLGLPHSISANSQGLSWSYARSEFPDIAGGQRLVLKRLREGPLLLVSFTDRSRPTPPDTTLPLRDAEGSLINGYGMFAALSYDEGQTWPVRKLLTAIRPGEPSQLHQGRGWTGAFTMTALRAEDGGYLAATQTPDNVIQLISSGLHYQFDLKWLEAGPYQAIGHWNMDLATSGSAIGSAATASHSEPYNALSAAAVVQGSSALLYATGAPLPWDSTSALAAAIDFHNAGTSNNDGSYYRVEDADLLTGHHSGGTGYDALEVALWIKPTQYRQSQLLRHTTPGTDQGHQLYMDAAGFIHFRIEQLNGAVAQLQSSRPIPLDGHWHYVKATWRGASQAVNFAITIDGNRSVATLQNSTITKLPNVSGPLTIGGVLRADSTSGQFLAGQLDHVSLRTFPANSGPGDWPPAPEVPSSSVLNSHWLHYQ